MRRFKHGKSYAIGMGRVFPHPYGDDKYLTLRVGLTPAVDELTLDFAKALIREEALGQRGATDFLRHRCHYLQP